MTSDWLNDSSSLSPSTLSSWTPRFCKRLRKVLFFHLLSYRHQWPSFHRSAPNSIPQFWVRRLVVLLFPHCWVNFGVNHVALSPAFAVSGWKPSVWMPEMLRPPSLIPVLGSLSSVHAYRGFVYNNSQLINSLRQFNCKFHLCLVPPAMLGAQTWPL